MGRASSLGLSIQRFGVHVKIQTEPLMRVDVYSHFFKITKQNPRITGLLFRFAHKYTHMVLQQQRGGQMQRVPGKTFAAKTADNAEFRFHIGQLQAFQQFLMENYIEPYMFDIVQHELHAPKDVGLALKPQWKARDYQQEAIDFILQEDISDFHSRLVTASTGTGKSFMAAAAVGKLNKRTIYAVLPKYQEKTGSDLVSMFEISPKEVMLVQGSDQMRGLIQMGLDRVKLPKFIVMSLTTIQNFFKAYEEDRFSEDIKAFGCNPEDMCQILDVGTVVVDEAHEHLYSVFKLMVYTHVPKFIALSGTLISDDPFIERIQHLMFPREIRFDKIKMEKYIKCYPISYVFRDIQSSKIRISEYGSSNYSQVAFEKSLMKRKDLLSNYMKLVDYLVQLSYLDNYIPGDKLAIYAGSVAMCTYMTECLKALYPRLDVKRYCESDPYSNVIESDIRVTTILSAGTALDIPNLRAVVMTNSINSSVANLQTLGRLRKLPDRDVKFYYLYCSEIKKQVDYHYRRMELFRDRVAVIKEFKAPLAV